MDISITGQHINTGDALREHVTERLTAGVAKYFDRSVDAHVTFTREGHGFRCETSVHLSSGITMQSHAEAGEIYAAFESATERLEKRLRRYKRRLKDHHNRAKEPVSQVAASAYVIQAEAAQAEVSEPEDLTPIIIAETTADVKTLTVGEAVMQMDLQEAPALLFHNVAHGGLNMVYRRPDGHIGWIDPNEQSG